MQAFPLSPADGETGPRPGSRLRSMPFPDYNERSIATKRISENDHARSSGNDLRPGLTGGGLAAALPAPAFPPGIRLVMVPVGSGVTPAALTAAGVQVYASFRDVRRVAAGGR